VKAMGLGYAVVTSVTRDDLRDGGARAFAETVREIRKANPGCRIELLVPDFSGRCLRRVVESGPDVLGHNTETVRRLFPAARPKGSYEGSLRLLNAVKKMNPRMLTKSGLMVGLGETAEEVLETMEDMRSSGCDLLTVGQYLRPSGRQLPVKKYYSPGEFREFGEAGKSMGFLHVESGPLVRSSYMAERCFRGVKP
jgi:lipoic acid synthetase